MKFEAALNNELSDAVLLVNRVRELCNKCCDEISNDLEEGTQREKQFVATGLYFSRINYDAIDGIMNSIKYGFIDQSMVLLRWHLELSHLYYFLWKDQEAYQRWLTGTQFHPKEISKVFIEKNYATWQKPYSIWSDITHGNAKYVENCLTISREARVSGSQIIDVARILRSLTFNGQKINSVSANILKGIADTIKYNPIAKQYNLLEHDILTFYEEQNNRSES